MLMLLGIRYTPGQLHIEWLLTVFGNLILNTYFKLGSPGTARTCDIRINSSALLPTELLGNKLAEWLGHSFLAVSVGFEPTARITTNNTLAGCRFKPLIQLTIFWCSEAGSNRHAFRRQILSLMSIPISPSEHYTFTLLSYFLLIASAIFKLFLSSLDQYG